MSSVYTGDSSTVANSLSRTVTGATNATPIVITTSASHLFGTKDWVVIANVAGNTAANGTWQITKLSATTFSLTGSVGSGAYTSGGTAVCVSLTPQFDIPSDGDAPTAASVNVALESLADRTQFLALLARMQSKAWTADTTWAAPANVVAIGFLVGCGGGGAGGDGGVGSTAASFAAAGGAGGGGSIERMIPVVLVGGTTYTIDIGAAGSGMADSFWANNGADTTFTDGTTTYRFEGGHGGAAGPAAVDTATLASVSMGGPTTQTVLEATSYALTFATATVGALLPLVPSAFSRGGAGITKNAGTTSGNSFAGCNSPQGNVGGAGAASGTTSGGTRIGGGGGGGGGAGPYAAGGAGGAGGNGAAVTGVAGTAGTAGAANSGAGGGGGGGGGGAGTTPGSGGAGGAGGSGKLTLYYWGAPS